jgi:rifampicin phosphotransferase
MTQSIDTDFAWEPPGPGPWQWDRIYKRTTFTVPFQEVFAPGMAEGFHQFTSRYGLVLDRIAVRYVNGYAYAQPQLAGIPARAQAKPGSPPPTFVIRLMCAIVPELRRRHRAARNAISTQLWQRDRETWNESGRAARMAGNLALQDEPISTMDDRQLADHILRTSANARDGARTLRPARNPDPGRQPDRPRRGLGHGDHRCARRDGRRLAGFG